MWLACIGRLTFLVRVCLVTRVTKRRSSWACIGNPKPEQETIKGTCPATASLCNTLNGTRAQETPAHQCRPTTLHIVQGSNPPIRVRYMQLVKLPHTHQTTPRATSAAVLQHGMYERLSGGLSSCGEYRVHRTCVVLILRLCIIRPQTRLHKQKMILLPSCLDCVVVNAAWRKKGRQVCW